MLHPTVFVHIFRLTVYLCCTRRTLASDTATVVILGRAGVCKFVETGVGAEAGCSARYMRRGCGVGLPAVCCLGVCLSAAAAANSASEIYRKRVAVIGGVHVGVDLAANPLCTSLVRSDTCVLSWALSFLIWSMVGFMVYAVMLDKVAIFRFIVSFMCWLNIFCRGVN